MQRSWRVEEERAEKAKAAFFIVEPNPAQLTEIGKLLEAGRRQTVVDAMVPFESAPRLTRVA